MAAACSRNHSECQPRGVTLRRRINYSALRITSDIIASTWQVAAATENGLRRFFLRHRFLGDDDTGELHDVGDGLDSILAEGRLERQFSISDLG